MHIRVAVYLLRNKAVRTALLAAVLFVVFAPVLVFCRGRVGVLAVLRAGLSG